MRCWRRLGRSLACTSLTSVAAKGSWQRALANRGARVTGCDPFIAETAWTTHGSGSYRLVKAAADALSEPDQSADLVLFVFSLHHVPGREALRAR